VLVYKSFLSIDRDAEDKYNLKLTQNVALQLHFDVQFIMQCMTSRENKEVTAVCQEALALIERHIDPFDLSVFNPYLATNVTRSVLKYQALYGILIPIDRYTLLTSMKATLPHGQATSSLQLSGGSLGSGQASECSIQLSTCTNRFPLLPIASKKVDIRSGSRQTNRNIESQAHVMTQVSPISKSEQRISKIDSTASSNQGQSTPKTRKREKSPVNKAWSAFEEMSNKWFGTGK
jgi:hypothetical protein